MAFHKKEDIEWDPHTEETFTAWQASRRPSRRAFGSRNLLRPVKLPPSLDDSPPQENLKNGTTPRRSGSLTPLPPKPMRRSFSLQMRDSSTNSTSTNTVSSETDVMMDVTPRRKKIRARRASIQGCVAPLSESSFSHLARSSAEEWKRVQSPSDWESESSPRSVSSSRKRGVEGSPLCSDMDESSNNSLSQSSHSRQRSRSRIFSPPPLAQSVDRNIMDLDTSTSSSEGGNSQTTAEASFDESFHVMEHKINIESEHDVLETMPNYNDLKYLIHSLFVQRNSQGGWSVAARPNWTPARRSTFLSWAIQLGFSLRAAGGPLTYLQISRSKGEELLNKLQAAQLIYKSGTAQKPRPIIHKPKVSARTPEQASDDAAALELAQQLHSLSIDNKSLVRVVTLEPAPTTAFEGRPAFGQASYEKSPRPSFDHAAPTQDIFLHLHGRTSPGDVAPSKPPRMSNSSRSSLSNSIPVINATQSFEIIETPLMKSDWGSCPVQGRDWGTSSRCEDSPLQALMERFQESCRAAGTRDSFSESASSLSSNLQLELAAAKNGLAEDKGWTRFYDEEIELRDRRKKQTYAKHKRMSLFLSASHSNDTVVPTTRLFKSRTLALDEIAETSLSAFTDKADNLSPCDKFKSSDVEFAVSESVLTVVFSFLTESELLRQASLVCTAWADAAATAHANLMLASIGCDADEDEYSIDDVSEKLAETNSIALSMERSWQYLITRFPWAQFLAEGGMKRVYKVFNTLVGEEEAISVMDTDEIVDKNLIAAELAVSSMLSSLARRGICPNFVLTRGVFTCPHEPPSGHWGTAHNKQPRMARSIENSLCLPPEPEMPYPGRFQYIRMELCSHGDAEEYIKGLPDEALDSSTAQIILFQIAFALYAAAERYSVKHYDIKLLNIFLQRPKESSGGVVLRYGLGSHVFALRMASKKAFIAKLADFGTANVKPETNGQPVTIAQFTTLENTPMDFLILGDKASQGHGHDYFGLGLCMLHLFTGHRPYEEILADVTCPPSLKKRLRCIWENEKVKGYEVIRSVILSDAYKDEAGHITEGEPDETLYNTLYRFLVLFGIPEDKFRQKECPKVWEAITECLAGHSGSGSSRLRRHNPLRRRCAPDASQYNRDKKRYSILHGTNKYIARARSQLESMEGGLELLFHLCAFDPVKRASAMDVLNSTFMTTLREEPGISFYSDHESIHSYTAFATQNF